MTTEVPIHDLDAEATVISAAVLSSELADEGLALLNPNGSDFYSSANSLIWRAVAGLTEQGLAVDQVAVAGWLRSHTPQDAEHSLLQAVGGTQYIAQVVDATPAVVHVEQHARRVLDLSRQRALQKTLIRLGAECKVEHEDTSQWIDSVEGRVYEATSGDRVNHDALSYRQLVAPAMEETRELTEGRRRIGIPIGLRCLDDHLLGWQGGWLVYVAARPGIGKTAFLQGMIEHSASLGYFWTYFSLEMSARELRERSVARHSGIPINALATGRLTREQWDAYANAVEYLAKLPILIDDSSTLTPARLRAKVRRNLARARAEWPECKIGGVVIDHMQLTDCDDPKGKTRNEQLTLVSRSNKQVAKDNECVVLAGSQLSRPQKGSRPKMPTLADLRESGALEQDADVVLGLHREDEYRDEDEPRTGNADVGVLKGRSRGSDTHHCKFDGRTTKFYEEGTSFDNAPDPLDDEEDWRNRL